MSSSTLQLMVCWELVGVCSFVLIGHWWEEKANSDAALKAFITNRVGDIGPDRRRDHPVLRCGADLRHRRHQHPGAQRRHQPPGAAGGVVLADRRRHVEVGPVHPAHLAPRRHGRPHAGVCPHPRRHDGRGRHLHGLPALRGLLRGPVDRHVEHQPARARRRGDRVGRGGAGVRAERHQEGPRLLHGLAARLHGDGARRRAPGRRRCSTCSPTPSSRPACSSVPGRSATPSTAST